MSHCPDCYMGGEGAWECGHEEKIATLETQLAERTAELGSLAVRYAELRTALRQVAEASQAVHDELLDRPENILDLSDEVYVPFKDALALPAVQDVLKSP